jgi:ATP-dependent protease HslVU (ClpYQ) peptidase subunit
MVVTDGENAYLISGGGDVMNAEACHGTHVVGE